MKAMMIVETRDPIGVADVAWGAEFLAGLHAAGCPGTLMLVENGVLATRRDAEAPAIRSLLGGGVEIVADRFALAERGIAEAELAPGIAAGDLGLVVDRLVAGDSVIWR